MTALDKVAGGNDIRYIETATASNGKFYALVVNTDTVFTTLTDKDNNDLVSIYNLSGNTISTGMLIPCYNNVPITTIKLASGSCIAYGNIYDVI